MKSRLLHDPLAVHKAECGFLGKLRAVEARDARLDQDGIAFGKVNILIEHDAKCVLIVYAEGIDAVLRLGRTACIEHGNVIIGDVVRLFAVEEVLVVAFITDADRAGCEVLSGFAFS